MAIPSQAQVDATGLPAPATEPGRRYFSRHLSWLAYNARVLALAEEDRLPLLDRVLFVSIFSANLDEFFQVRVAGLHDQIQAGIDTVAPDGLSPSDQLVEVRRLVRDLMSRVYRLWNDELQPALAQHDIRIVGIDDVAARERRALTAVFRDQIFPVLTPLAVDPSHPFPYISNLSLNLAVRVREQRRVRPRFARVKVPPLLPRFVRSGEGTTFVPVEQLIAAHLDQLFPSMEIVSRNAFRVTRDADIDVADDEATDLMAAVQTELRRQRRSARVVRLEIDTGMSKEVLGLLQRELELEPDGVYTINGLLDLGTLGALYDLERPDLKKPKWTPLTPAELAPSEGTPPDVFSLLRRADVLVHHPYESFATSVETFIDQAARDPDVLAIKQTLYRTSGPVSPIAESLMAAAESGKQVVALVELKARGDEQANIAWARRLEQAGVHVVYGVVGLKTHAKVSLVVRQERGGIRNYVHFGTGNYNPATARTYEDLGLLTADPALGADAADLFNFLTGYSRQRRYSRLLVAPLTLRSELLRLIRRESHAGGRVTMKLNNLIDPEIIDALYAASSAGAEIDLIVRSICGLRPRLAGVSDRVRVRSLVGRFLEHSRIFRFGDGAESVHYIGSSDLMQRNLDGRVEVLVPVQAPELKARLDEVFDVCLRDTVLAWELAEDGTWAKVSGEGEPVNAQEVFMELAVRRARGEEAALGA
ncbi:MAG TPA: polyphosphate kinase 1 [Candidatus Dormibacteraeota bacterium]